ncbi:MAG: DUF3369 domain-containing protein [Clostridium sp.]|nr:DUF3369 domain-containing protein [Clostridium sp.]
MRKINSKISSEHKIIVVDDERGILDSLSVIIKRLGYQYTGVNNPLEAIERIKREDFDLLILDFLMEPLLGDEVVKEIRKFNRDLYILLLTGYKDLAPPLKTIKTLDIQGYCEKTDNFDQLILLIESAIKTISQRKTIKVFKDGLKKILDSVPKIYQLQSVSEILENILGEVMFFVKCTNAFIMVDNFTTEGSKEKSIFKGVGTYDVNLEKFMKMLEPSFMESIGYARASKECIRTNEGIILPLIDDSMKTLGIIYLEINHPFNKIELLKIFAAQVATSINNIYLHSLVSIKNDELDRTYNELQKRYLDAIQVLRLAVDAKDVYTRGHSDRVAYYAVKIGKSFNLKEEELQKLKAAGIFHDIGKIGIADDILFKTDKLSDAEYDEIKKHPIKGAHILSAVSMFKDIIPLVKHHHERIDGRGYPYGIKGDEIPFLARIVSVADAFDAMTSDRQYRSKLNIDEAKKQLLLNSGTQFDSNVVNNFIALLEDFDEMQKEIEHTYNTNQFLEKENA